MDTTHRLRPFVVGSALALTIAIMYALCAALWAIWNEAALDFLNALFHGLDFRRLQLPDSTARPGIFVLPLVLLSTWGFIMGLVYAGIYNLFKR
jgi:hypothetical protein